MSQISLKSISGITSITTPAGVDNVFTVHTNDTTEKFRVDQTGNQNISGIVTASNFKTGSSNLHSTGLTVGNNFLHSTGINVGTGATIHVPATNVLTLGTNSNERLRITSDGRVFIGESSVAGSAKLVVGNGGAENFEFTSGNSTFNGGLIEYIHRGDGNTRPDLNMYVAGAGAFKVYTNGSNERLRIASSGQIGLSGANYGSSGQVLTSGGSGSAATWSTITGTTINNNANNRLITGSGTANTLEGESDLTFDGNQLYIDCNNYAYPLVVNSTQSSVRAVIRQTNDANANSGLAIQKKHSSLHPANHWYGDVSFEGWDGSGYHKAGLIECVAEGTPANDNMPGGLRFSTNAGAAGVTERLRIKPDGNVEVKTGNLVMTSGKGIDFSADSSGTLQALANSFNAELLHDYEVGTFVPNIQYDTGTNQYTGSPGSGQSVSSSKGEYIRIGDMVWAAGQITLVANRNSTQSPHISIGGFPYNGLHTSQQNSLMTGWGGAAWPKNDSNPSYRLIYSYHNYTTLNFRFTQTSGNNGIDGFNFHVYYRCPT